MEAVTEKENERKALEQVALAEFLAIAGHPGDACGSRAAGGDEGDRTRAMNGQPRFTILGKLISVVLVAGPRRRSAST